MYNKFAETNQSKPFFIRIHPLSPLSNTHLTNKNFICKHHNGLDPELRDLVCIFYLCLRGMDTIEDDMTLPIEPKAPLLRSFYNISEKG
ncbi:14390_t:CDS:2 [Cetraspora pellucida]|uniref:14390_t:CDS:1 n=1 Tax=Cetraspora pellucida TaxID=1433469 RepID=A0A9N9F1Y1_9GLOM|nr:14390_t:CDS:2 [Cetraspora pellucida]